LILHLIHRFGSRKVTLMNNEVARIYGDKVRVRACGICWQEGRLLMVNHSSITPTNFWAPPGGGVEFGDSVADTLKKEFKEETGLLIEPGEFLFGCEFIEKPIHSIELFYRVSVKSGQLKTGRDPEIQIIKEVRFLSPEEIRNIPGKELHGIFRLIDSPVGLQDLRGFFRI
jgi:8-oxo-dGTP diphosphatase